MDEYAKNASHKGPIGARFWCYRLADNLKAQRIFCTKEHLLEHIIEKKPGAVFWPGEKMPEGRPEEAHNHRLAHHETKPNLTCLITQFPLAMQAIANVHDYERGPLVKGDYLPSLLRHLFKVGGHKNHDAAVAWNAIAWLEVRLRDERERDGHSYLQERSQDRNSRRGVGEE